MAFHGWNLREEGNMFAKVNVPLCVGQISRQIGSEMARYYIPIRDLLHESRKRPSCVSVSASGVN